MRNADGLERERFARVVSIGKNAVWIAFDDEASVRVATLRRTGSGERRSMLVPGDRVRARLLEDGKCLVDAMLPRESVLERRTAEGRSKVMAANVDSVVTVTALADPPPRLVTLDQLLAFCELQDVAVLVVLTKPDLADAATTEAIVDIYRHVGYDPIVVAPKFGTNMPALRQRLTGRRSLLCGVSGVGKSSIFRWLGGEAAVGQVSRHGLGRQTTSAARLFHLPSGFLIDSPGVAEFGLGRIDAERLVHGFREFEPFLGGCRFTDCRHLTEPDCAVRAAVAAGAVPASRYDSYRRILEE